MKAEKVKSKKAKVVKILIYGFCLFFFGWTILAAFLAKCLIVKKPQQKSDAIWVLSGSSTYLERNRKAAELYKQGISDKIILTNDGNFGGWSQIEERNPAFTELAKRELIAQGVPAIAIEVLPKFVQGTNDEADLFSDSVKTRQLDSVLLVTSAYHSRRTLWTFERAASKYSLSVEIGLEYAPVGEQTPPPLSWWTSRKGWSLVGGEYVKLIYYWLYY